MMVHHDDIRRLRVAAGLDHVAARKLRAFLAETIFASGGDAGPDGRLFGQVSELCEIACLRRRGPARNTREQARNIARSREQRALLSGEFQSMAAKIIRTPL